MTRYAFDLHSRIEEANELWDAIKTRHRDEHDPAVECTDLACLLSLYVLSLVSEARSARGRRLLPRRHVLSHSARLGCDYPRAWRHRRERNERNRNRRGWEYGCSAVMTGGRCQIWPQARGCDVCGVRLSTTWLEGRVVGRIGDRDVHVILCSDECARNAVTPKARSRSASTTPTLFGGSR